MKSALVLTFHGIRADKIIPRSERDYATDRYVVSTERFEQVISMISPRKCCIASAYAEKEEGEWFILTFDDGLISDFEHVFPILKGNGIRGTFFITENYVGISGHTTTLHLREMAEGGMEIGSHGLTHRYLTTMTRNDAMREILESRNRLEQEIGFQVKSFAPVGGHYRKWMIDYAQQAGYKVFATMIPGRTNSREDLMLVRRNHIQSHHDCRYIKRLLEGKGLTLWKNGARYRVLHGIQLVLGLKNYDRIKKSLLRSHPASSKGKSPAEPIEASK